MKPSFLRFRKLIGERISILTLFTNTITSTILSHQKLAGLLCFYLFFEIILYYLQNSIYFIRMPQKLRNASTASRAKQKVWFYEQKQTDPRFLSILFLSFASPSRIQFMIYSIGSRLDEHRLYGSIRSNHIVVKSRLIMSLMKSPKKNSTD